MICKFVSIENRGVPFLEIFCKDYLRNWAATDNDIIVLSQEQVTQLPDKKLYESIRQTWLQNESQVDLDIIAEAKLGQDCLPIRANYLRFYAKKHALACQDSGPTFVRWLRFTRFIMPRRFQNDVFNPCCEEIAEDYYVALEECATVGQLRWMVFCFCCRCLWLVLDLLRAVIADQTVGNIIRLFRSNPPTS